MKEHIKTTTNKTWRKTTTFSTLLLRRFCARLYIHKLQLKYVWSWLSLWLKCPTVWDAREKGLGGFVWGQTAPQWSKCSVVARPAFQGSKGYVALFGVKLANSFRYKEKGWSGFVGGQTSSRYRDWGSKGEVALGSNWPTVPHSGRKDWQPLGSNGPTVSNTRRKG